MWVPPYNNQLNQLFEESLELLKTLIATPSFSKDEDQTAEIISAFFEKRNIPTHRISNNIIVRNKHFDDSKKTILLNSHHDTVKPASGYTLDPFTPMVREEKLFGLGSNDAGGCLISLIATFRYYFDRADLPFNLLLVASAEEEISGKNGIELALKELVKVGFEGAIVGEPTEMKAAVAEKGLMVVDCYAKGKSGHAARNTGINAIQKAIEDIEKINQHSLKDRSEWLGEVKLTVTMIESGTQHNVIPDTCHFVIDARTTDVYDNHFVIDYLRKNLECEVKERSLRLNSSQLPEEHIFSRICNAKGIPTFGSPTMSDQALIPFPSIKIGPGKSERSHMADEFIYLEDIKLGIAGYIDFLNEVFTQKT